MAISDIAIIGGGIVGLATAYALVRRHPGRLVVAEAEEEVARHQTGHNSGVIHSGLYYKPGSAKARNCAVGREAMVAFCVQHDIPHRRCGKIVVATHPGELAALAELERRGQANGLTGMRRLDAAQLKEYEPHVVGSAGLHVPETGVVDYKAVARKLAELIRAAGGEIVTGARVRRVERRPDEIILHTARGEVRGHFLINCGGLQADRIARLCGLDPGLQIVPFRGEYYALVPARRHLVRGLIYPVPDPRFPFLGVHFTRSVYDEVEAGPNAVLAFRREGYRRRDVSPRDLAQMGSYRGFWRMALKHWRTGLGEMWRSLSKRSFHRALQRLIPELALEDIVSFGAGVRAQAVDATGALVDDFHFVEAEHMLHVLNAPSPAATASLSIGESIADRVLPRIVNAK
jgi:(S)-2-hydroxyglutarate dehydrogenase